jgi:hypothetical protein
LLSQSLLIFASRRVRFWGVDVGYSDPLAAKIERVAVDHAVVAGKLVAHCERGGNHYCGLFLPRFMSYRFLSGDIAKSHESAEDQEERGIRKRGFVALGSRGTRPPQSERPLRRWLRGVGPSERNDDSQMSGLLRILDEA